VLATCFPRSALDCREYICFYNSTSYCCSDATECTDLQNGDTPIARISDLEGVLERVVSYALGFAGIVLFILLIVGGFKYITSGGDPKAVEGAKKTLTSAIIGLVLILVSYLVLILISNITGVDVTDFNIILS